MRFEPEGITNNPEIPFAKSMPDYIMRWLASRFLDTDTQEELGILTPEVRARKMAEDASAANGRTTRPGPDGRRQRRRTATATAPNGRRQDGGRRRGDDRHAAGAAGQAPGASTSARPARSAAA